MDLMKATCTASVLLILSSSSAAFTAVPQSPAFQKVSRQSSVSSWSRLSNTFGLMGVTVGDDTSSVSSNNNNAVDRYRALGSWAQNTFPDATVSPSVEFRESSRSGGFGVFATNDIQKGSIVFSIPGSACVRVQDALDDEDCGKTFQALIDKAGPGGITVAMAGYLAKEYLRLQEPEDSGTIKFAPYLETLPWERGINNQEHVLFWSDEDVETYLKGSISYDEAVGLRKEVELAVRVLNGIIGPSVRAARGEQVESGKITWPWEKKAPAQDPSILVDGIDAAVRGAFVTLLTRSFAQGGAQSEERLVPLLDMLQHSDEPSVTHQTREDGTVEVRARCDIVKGDEIFNQYQDEKARSMPYHRFFTRFGFVPGIAEPIRDLLAERSTIFFPQREAI